MVLVLLGGDLALVAQLRELGDLVGAEYPSRRRCASWAASIISLSCSVIFGRAIM